MSDIKKITNRVIERSRPYRSIYLKRVEEAKTQTRNLTCANLAHTVAACSQSDKESFLDKEAKNIAIVTAYNDMLSAHAPYYRYPEMIKKEAKKYGMLAQVASGVPAMCDGVTQGQDGMDLSLFSRDNIAQSTALGLSHNAFDGVSLLGICDKIVPGLFMGAMAFGHLPALFLPAGPMKSGISNDKKAKIRQEYAKGNIGAKELLEAEKNSYSAPGTCTFYGTANTNQMLLEVMGLHLPQASFVPALSSKRDEMNAWGIEVLATNINKHKSIADMISEQSFINAIVMLLATGGSTNHTLHLIAMARVCGIVITWKDFADISRLTPLIAKIYPNGSADINHFHEAGGTSFVIKELLKEGLLHEDVATVLGSGLKEYAKAQKSKNIAILRPAREAFDTHGGLVLLEGNIGKAVLKTSALKTKKRRFSLQAKVFHSQEELKRRFEAGELYCDFAAILPFQGASSNGMPELHGLSPILGLLQDKAHEIVLVTDGRMSGASGKFPAIIHCSPEAKQGGRIGQIQEGDVLSLDIGNGIFSVDSRKEVLKSRQEKKVGLQYGSGRELFVSARLHVSSAEEGASQFYLPGEEPC